MIKAYIDFWKRAFDFSGRSTRPDYWWAYLVNVIIITILTVLFEKNSKKAQKITSCAIL